MNKCVKIIVTGQLKDGFLAEVVQKHARKLSIEGTANLVPPNKAKIIACGTKEDVDNFVDVIHKESSRFPIDEIEVEPFLKDKDYRSAFRIIE